MNVTNARVGRPDPLFEVIVLVACCLSIALLVVHVTFHLDAVHEAARFGGKTIKFSF